MLSNFSLDFLSFLYDDPVLFIHFQSPLILFSFSVICHPTFQADILSVP